VPTSSILNDQREERRISREAERTLDPGSDDEETFGGGRVNIPPMKQKLVGHRNARTMIKVGIPCLNL